MNEENKNRFNLLDIGPMVAKNKLGKIVCRHAWTSFDIYPNGNIAPCCYLPKKVMGNINSQSVEEIWNGEKFQKFRKEMKERGAHKTCSRCPVLMGMNHWENLNWYINLNYDSNVYKNAKLNEEEIAEGKIKLKSKIRRLKYTPRYTCNLNCYHCCQDQYRLHGFDQLDEEVFAKVMKIFPTLQIINPFGGEPFMFKETYVLMQAMIDINSECQLYTTTNANCFTGQVINLLGEINIGKIAVSMDGFTKQTYEKYRRGGDWGLLLKNIKVLTEIRKNNNFNLIFNASFNNETYKELPIFIELCKKYKAVGRPVLMQRKANHTIDFWKKHMKMSKKQWQEFKNIVNELLKDNSLPPDTRNSLVYMRQVLKIYPYCRFKIYKNSLKDYFIKILKLLGLYKVVYFLYKKLIRKYA